MKIHTNKVDVARKLLQTINYKLKTIKSNDYLTLNHYQNCREQGFIIGNLGDINGDKPKYTWVAFSENRSSDDIVVYPSTGKESMPFEGITETAYKRANYFRYDDYEGAADFCIKHLDID
jgi:hypothetical protein